MNVFLTTNAISGHVQCIAYIKLSIALVYYNWVIVLFIFSVVFVLEWYKVLCSSMFKWLNLISILSINRIVINPLPYYFLTLIHKIASTLFKSFIFEDWSLISFSSKNFKYVRTKNQNVINIKTNGNSITSVNLK